MTPTVTVIVVAYNHARFVVECLESVRMQTRKPDATLIVDDASPDATARVVLDYLERHPNFAKFESNPKNLGLNATLNKMLALVQTDYFTVLAADDFLRADRLEVQLQQLAEVPEAVLAYSDASVVDEDSRLITESSSTEYPWPHEPGRSESTFAELLGANWIPAASIMARTGVVRNSGGYPDLLFEDYELLVRLAKSHRFTYSVEPLVSVRRVGTSMMNTLLTTSNPDYLRTLDAALTHYEGASPELEDRARSRRWELAKSAIATAMPRTQIIRMMLRARKGAKNPVTFLFHVGRALLTRRASGRIALRK